MRAIKQAFRAAKAVDQACRAWAKARYDHAIQLPVLPSQGERWLRSRGISTNRR